MANNFSDIFRELSEEASFAHLADAQPGRLVVHRTTESDIFPVNFVVDSGKIYFRTAEGSKLFSLHVNNRVLFEADGRENGTAWSVVVRGDAEVITNREEITHAETLGLRPWAPNLKYNWVRITPTEVTGREFEIADEPERY